MNVSRRATDATRFATSVGGKKKWIDPFVGAHQDIAHLEHEKKSNL
ncbi:MAG: hypothetical protein O7G13_05840 [Alphaproteobacteria bacterium]|nr:hypothetical protein [Alphaproteobacteria bacterium]